MNLSVCPLIRWKLKIRDPLVVSDRLTMRRNAGCKGIALRNFSVRLQLTHEENDEGDEGDDWLLQL